MAYIEAIQWELKSITLKKKNCYYKDTMKVVQLPDTAIEQIKYEEIQYFSRENKRNSSSLPSFN